MPMWQSLGQSTTMTDGTEVKVLPKEVHIAFQHYCDSYESDGFFRVKWPVAEVRDFVNVLNEAIERAEKLS